MSWKKLLIILGFIFLVGTGVRLYIYFQIKQINDIFEDRAVTHQEQAKDANLKYITFYLRDIVQSWGEQNNSFDNFAKSTDNNKKIDIFTKKQDYTKANVEHKIFTTPNNFVVKVKPIDEKIIYCIDSNIASKDPYIKIIGFNGNNFNSATDCSNEVLK